ncbi:TetR/AcrR family transcriptional regulator [Actinocrispum sp. NPDC049592]|uniref:TetR/AcrR family transcriptional regulator n=1 Tax=Actinocrispum sp. NPDC049592 TaxID=3154835 RepID=UPI003438AA38
MGATRTARELARMELTQAIKDEARRQLAVDGPQKLSLRSISRALEMVSSSLFRYFPSRDDLLTALIIDAYNAMGQAAEDAAQGAPREAWIAACHAVRAWAKQNPHEYALIYGSPIPGYKAPRETVAAAARVPLLLIGLLSKAWQGMRVEYGEPSPPLTPGLAQQWADVGREVAPELPVEVLNRGGIVWSQLFGMLSFELFGQFVGSVDPADEFFAHAVGQMADFVGLKSPF